MPVFGVGASRQTQAQNVNVTDSVSKKYQINYSWAEENTTGDITESEVEATVSNYLTLTETLESNIH